MLNRESENKGGLPHPPSYNKKLGKFLIQNFNRIKDKQGDRDDAQEITAF